MLEHLIGSSTRVKLLQVFFSAGDRPFFGRELARMIGSQLNGIRREIANLEDIGLLKQVDPDVESVEILGTERSKYYHLNPDFFLIDELRALLTKARVLEEQSFIDDIKRKAGNLKLFLLTGRFTASNSSPTDMLIVGRVKPLALAKIIRDFEKFLGHPLRYTLMEEKEFRDRREIGDKFIYGIFESKFITVLDTGLLN